jgi:hypothetical protein
LFQRTRRQATLRASKLMGVQKMGAEVVESNGLIWGRLATGRINFLNG